MKILAILTMVGMSLVAGSHVLAQSEQIVTPFQVRSFAVSCFQLVRAENWSALASLYHMPPTGEFDAEQEQAEIENSLRAVGAAFGRVSQGELADEVEKITQLTVEGLDSGYWEEHSKHVEVSYRVDFTGLGRGFVTFNLVIFANRMQLRAVSFGLPEADPLTPARMKGVMQKLKH